MKALFIGLLMATSFNAFAESYKCELKVIKGEQSITLVSVEQQPISMIGGVLGEHILNQKKDKKGVIINESKLILTGGYMSSYEAEASKFEGEILIMNTRNKIKGKKIIDSQVTMLPFAEFKGAGDFQSAITAETLIDGIAATINVQCSYLK